MTRILAGRRPVLEALRGKTRVLRVLVESEERSTDVLVAARERGVRIDVKDRKELDRLTEGIRHQGVVAIADPYPYVTLEELLDQVSPSSRSVFVALDEITDPQNLGAIVRSAVALGADGIIVPKHRAAGITPAVSRASAGATEHATIARVTNLQRTLLGLSEQGMEIVGLDANAELAIRSLSQSMAPRVLVIGSEGKGLRRMVRQRCDIVVQIPQDGPMDSLNASVAAAIAMYELAAKRGED